jgi:hypothetical protein
LGVLRPFGDPNLTDEEGKEFIGTLRYSSPEFLLRAEEDTTDGWRAVTFYQLGAVLHDLIMRRPLFQEFSKPFALLVEAVKNEKPQIRSDDANPDLVLLAQRCLVKSPTARLALVSWSDFELPPGPRRSAEITRERVKKRTLLARTQSLVNAPRPGLSAGQVAMLIKGRLECVIRGECIGNDSFPPLELTSDADAPVQVRVMFAASPAHELPHQLMVRFDCELLDEATMAVRVSASACLLQVGVTPGEPPARVGVFRGPLDSDSLTLQVQDFLWNAIDLAQREGASSAYGGDAHWLDSVRALAGQE